jgi:hypothetical protein
MNPQSPGFFILMGISIVLLCVCWPLGLVMLIVIIMMASSHKL